MVTTSSAPRWNTAAKTLEKKIKKEKEQVEKEVWHLSNQEFYSEEDALKAAREKENEVRGRPRKDEPIQTVYRVKVEFAEDKSVIEKEMLKKGKFIVKPCKGLSSSMRREFFAS